MRPGTVNGSNGTPVSQSIRDVHDLFSPYVKGKALAAPQRRNVSERLTGKRRAKIWLERSKA